MQDGLKTPRQRVVQRIDQVCNRFEDAWKAGQCPQIQEYLEAGPESKRPALLAELVLLDIEYRQRHVRVVLNEMSR